MKNIFLLMSSILLLASCGDNKNEPLTPSSKTKKEANIVRLTDVQYANAGIQTGKMSLQNISSTLKLNGKIDVPPQSLIAISAPLGGYLKKTHLLNGMYVNKGEIIATMEDAQYIELQQDYLSAKTQSALNKSEYERQKELNQSKATSDKVFEQAKANYQMQVVKVKSLEEKLKLIGINPYNLTTDKISKSIAIHAPISGFISSVNVNIGKYVQPSDVLFELVNPSDIHLTLTAFDKDIQTLSIGQKLWAYTNTNPEKKYACTIILISKNLSEDNSTEVHCHFEKYDKALIPGMFMNAVIELASNTGPALPEEAIVHFDNKKYVFLANGKNQFEMKEAKLGNTENGYTQILNQDWKDATFVTKGAYNLLMALKNRSDEE